MLLNLEGFQYAISLDLNMGYYHISLSKYSSNLCTIILPWGNHKYKCLPMGVCNYSDIFQDKMNEFFCGIEFITSYINDLLIISRGDWSNQLINLGILMKKLRANGLK